MNHIIYLLSIILRDNIVIQNNNKLILIGFYAGDVKQKIKINQVGNSIGNRQGNKVGNDYNKESFDLDSLK